MGKLLGRGAFGSVYAVTSVGRGEKESKYAIKIVRKLIVLII